MVTCVRCRELSFSSKSERRPAEGQFAFSSRVCSALLLCARLRRRQAAAVAAGPVPRPRRQGALPARAAHGVSAPASPAQGQLAKVDGARLPSHTSRSLTLRLTHRLFILSSNFLRVLHPFRTHACFPSPLRSLPIPDLSSHGTLCSPSRPSAVHNPRTSFLQTLPRLTMPCASFAFDSIRAGRDKWERERERAQTADALEPARPSPAAARSQYGV